MRRAALLLLLLLFPSPAHADPLDEPEVRLAVRDAVAWADAFIIENRKDCEDPCLDTAAETAEMAVAGRLDVRAWPSEGPSLHDTLRVPDNTEAGHRTGDDPTRELYALTHTGYDPRDFHGRDLWAQARDAVDAVVESGNSGYLSFLLMTLTDDPDGADAADRVAERLRGVSWNCSSSPTSDCIGMAVVALAHHGSLDDVTASKAFTELSTYRNSDGGYRSGAFDPASNANSAAWALMAHRAAGRPLDPDTISYLLGLQADDGSFHYNADARDRGDKVQSFVATMDALTALAGGHPLPAYSPPALPATVPVGVPVELSLGGAYDAGTWTFPDATLQGTRATRTFGHLGEHAFHLTALGDRHQYRGPATLEATNAAPTLHLPATLEADRATPLALAPTVTDPDGHDTTATYRLGDATGSLPADLRLTELGEHTLQVTARDDWGGTAVATTTVTVRNLRPVIDAVTLPATVAAGEPFTATVQGHDPDGAAPTATWRTGTGTQEGTTATWTLPAGHHSLSVTLRDADGAEATSSHIVRAVADHRPPEPAPTITDLTATVDGDALHVDATVDPPGASLRLRWTVDGDTFTRDAVTLPRTEPLPAGARSVDDVRLTATTTGGETHAEAGPLPVPDAAPADEPQPAPAPEPGPGPAPDDAEPEPTAEVPRIDGLQLRVDGGALTVTATIHPADARVDLAVLLDGVGTIHRDATLPHTQELDPAVRQVQVHLVATTRSHSTAAQLGPVELEPAPAAPGPSPRPEPLAEAPVTSTPGAPLPLALVALAALAARRRP